MNKSDRSFLAFATLFGVVGIAVGTIYLRSGEITVHAGRRPREPLAAEREAIGRIDRNDLAFYPLTLGWVAMGASAIVSAAVGWRTGSPIFGRFAVIGCVGVLAMGGATVAAAYWYGAG